MNSLLLKSLVYAGVTGLACLIIIFIYWVFYGRAKTATKKIRGSSVGSKAEVNRLVAKAKPSWFKPYYDDMKSVITWPKRGIIDPVMEILGLKIQGGLELSGVTLPLGSETKGILMVGNTGTGKSQAMGEIIDQVEDKVIFFDNNGDWIKKYYRKDDLILNPQDTRGESWSIWADAQTDEEIESLCAKLVPISGKSHYDYWEINAKIILVEAIKKLRDTNDPDDNTYPSTHELLEIIMYYEKKDFVEYFQGTEAQNVVNDQSTSTDAISVLRKIISSKIKVLRYLNDERDKAFSFRDWLSDETQQGKRLFIVMRTNDREALKPLFELWFNLAVAGKMNEGEENNHQKVWFVLDELAAANIKYNELETGLSELRKYGGCIMAGFQSIHKLRKVYGHNEAESILQQFNTKLFFKVDEPESAKWVSQQIGSQDIKELHQSHSIGEHEMRSSETYQLQEKNKLLVTPDEIMSLPELKGIFKDIRNQCQGFN